MLFGFREKFDMKLILIEFDGRMISLTALARKHGLGKATLWYRYMRLGWRGKALISPPYTLRKNARKRKEKQRANKYWICPACSSAKEFSLPTGHVTCMNGLCGWCARTDETALTPVCDFKGYGD